MSGNATGLTAEQQVAKALNDAVSRGVAPAMGLLVARGSEVLFSETAGLIEHPGQTCAAGIDTVFDLSSLTKPLATSACALVLVSEGQMPLGLPVAEVLPELCDTDSDARRRQITVRMLLSHCSGLPAHVRYFEELDSGIAGTRRGYRAVVDAVAATPLESDPGTRVVYSDLGFILLGELIERIAGMPLERFFTRQVLDPLGVDSVGFRRLPEEPDGDAQVSAVDSIAPCGSCEWRETQSLVGEVQDENCWAMGGVSGHAGLFGDLGGVHRLVAEWVAAADGRGTVLSSDIAREFWANRGGPDGSTWALGWDTPSAVGSTAGTQIGRPAFGHLGYTGTSVWVDRERGVHCVLLSNRVHPDRENQAIREFRPVIHDLVFGSLCTSIS